jgi:hypothetical protein
VFVLDIVKAGEEKEKIKDPEHFLAIISFSQLAFQFPAFLH